MKNTWSNIWKTVWGCDLYMLQDFYPGLPLIKLTDKRKHLLRCRVQAFLHLPSPSCICKDTAEWLMQPSCLSGSRSISSAARLTWTDDTLASLSTFVPFSFSMDICSRTSGGSSIADRPVLQHTPDLNIGQEGYVQWDHTCDSEMCEFIMQRAYVSTLEHYGSQSWLSFTFNRVTHMHRLPSARDTLG